MSDCERGEGLSLLALAALGEGDAGVAVGPAAAGAVGAGVTIDPRANFVHLKRCSANPKIKKARMSGKMKELEAKLTADETLAAKYQEA